jgi:hydroxyacylglutathione hydrolase
MIILSNTGGVAQTNCFVIADEATNEAVLFDAPDHTAGKMLDEIKRRNWNLIGLWLTHGHFDHIADHALVTRQFPTAKVLMHALDEDMLQRASIQSELFGLPFVVADRSADAYVEDGQILRIGNINVQAMYTPGHAPGHIAYWLPDEKVLIGGDLIIGGSIGRTDLPSADAKAMAQSLRRVMQLPPETKLLPGHGPVSTLQHERQTNFVLQSFLV